LALGLDLSIDYLLKELEKRRDVLLWMAERNIRDYRSVNNILSRYYNNPESFYGEILQNI